MQVNSVYGVCSFCLSASYFALCTVVCCVLFIGCSFDILIVKPAAIFSSQFMAHVPRFSSNASHFVSGPMGPDSYVEIVCSGLSQCCCANIDQHRLPLSMPHVCLGLLASPQHHEPLVRRLKRSHRQNGRAQGCWVRVVSESRPARHFL